MSCWQGAGGEECQDGDGDGYGDPGGNVECPSGSQADCDDADFNVKPGATEDLTDPATCEDGIDNNCNGLIDQAEAGCLPVTPPGPCAASASASTGSTVTGNDNSVWYLFVLAGVLLVGGLANRVYGDKKE
jgi:hypothetical protein